MTLFEADVNEFASALLFFTIFFEKMIFTEFFTVFALKKDNYFLAKGLDFCREMVYNITVSI